MTKSFFKIFTLLFALSTLFVACQKEETNIDGLETATLNEITSEAGESGIHRFGCYDLVFPITINFPDGSSQSLESYEAIKTALETWRSENEGSISHDNRPSLAFPIEVLSEEGELITVNDRSELRDLKRDCEGYQGRGHRLGRIRCYEIVFPVSVFFPADSTTLVVNSKEEMRTAIQNAEFTRENHPRLVFPFDLTNNEGETVSVNNEEELQALAETCQEECSGGRNGRGGHHGGRHGGHHGGGHDMHTCFELVFPVTVNFPDGSNFTGSSKEEIQTAIREWRTNNPNAEERPSLAFPITVTFEDSTTAIANNKEELRELRHSCD